MQDLATFRALLTSAGQQVLEAARQLKPRESDFLAHYSRLSRQHPADLARAALEIAILRDEAQSKFPFASQLYFTRPALEQASSYEIARWRARRYYGLERLYDFGCSVGSDTLALAEIAFTIGLDRDELRLAMAQANLAARGLAERSALVQADLTSGLPFKLLPASGVFFDPARRAAHKRAFSVRDYQPPLAVIKDWLERCPAVGVKISPGVDLAELRSYDAEVEFISLGGELKEAVLWFGALKTCRRRATLLPGGHTLATPYEPDDNQPLPLREPGAYLYEPDPAILRAGLVQQVGEQIGAAQLDPDIAYLTSNQAVETPFARRWQVEDWMPFGLKSLRAILRQRQVNHVVVKKRGSPLQPEQLIQALRLPPARQYDIRHSRTLFLTHLRGRPIVVICYPNQ
jgi:SAM-dependent methyltransferase